MDTWTERHAKAQRHVDDGRRVIGRQCDLIARQRALGNDTTISEKLLASFEQIQEIFEGDLVRICKGRE